MAAARRGPNVAVDMDCLRSFARASVDHARKELRLEVAGARAVRPLPAGLPPPHED